MIVAQTSPYPPPAVHYYKSPCCTASTLTRRMTMDATKATCEDCKAFIASQSEQKKETEWKQKTIFKK